MFLVVLAFVGGCVFDGLITRVPPDAVTVGRLMLLKHDIVDFYDKNRMLPESLDALEIFCSKNSIPAWKENAWGGPILYSILNGTTVVLKTYGPGGSSATVTQMFKLNFDVIER